jgi:hypothetical protein
MDAFVSVVRPQRDQRIADMHSIDWITGHLIQFPLA